MKYNSVKSYTVRIWIAGNYDDAIRALREFCEEGFCVSVIPTTYVYTGGVEEGICATVINYPRFPKAPWEVEAVSYKLAEFLRERLFQDSFTIECPETTEWYTRRE